MECAWIILKCSTPFLNISFFVTKSVLRRERCFYCTYLEAFGTVGLEFCLMKVTVACNVYSRPILSLNSLLIRNYYKYGKILQIIRRPQVILISVGNFALQCCCPSKFNVIKGNNWFLGRGWFVRFFCFGFPFRWYWQRNLARLPKVRNVTRIQHHVVE